MCVHHGLCVCRGLKVEVCVCAGQTRPGHEACVKTHTVGWADTYTAGASVFAEGRAGSGGRGRVAGGWLVCAGREAGAGCMGGVLVHVWASAVCARWWLEMDPVVGASWHATGLAAVAMSLRRMWGA